MSVSKEENRIIHLLFYLQMTHDKYWQNIARYLADELDESERAQFEQWVLADQERGREIRILKELMAGVDREAQAPSARDSWQSLSAKLNELDNKGVYRQQDTESCTSVEAGQRILQYHNTRHKRSKRDPVRTWMLGAVAVSILAMVMVLSIQQEFFALVDSDQVSQPEVVSAASGERLAFTLVDGTRIMLHAGSSIEISADYGQTHRTVTLDGEAYFEVEHDPQRPFTVYSKESFTRVLGTAFIVRAWEEEFQEVIVTDGEVAFGERQFENYSGQRAHLKKNQRAVLSRQAGITMHVVDDIDWYTGWTHGRFSFQARPLSEVVDRLNHWYGEIIRLDEPDLGNTAITADIDYGLPLRSVLEGIAMTMELKLQRRGQVYVLASHD